MTAVRVASLEAPIPLQAWANANQPGDQMRFKDGFWGQVTFVRDHLVSLVGSGLYWRDAERIATVVSTHTSKSIRLPVYRLARADLAIAIYLRNNFYDWKLSVVSETPIGASFDGLFHTTPPIGPDYTGDELASVYFEGFPREIVFGYFGASDTRKWSAAIRGDTALWATLFLLMRSVGAVKPLTWHTKESHIAALAEDRRRSEQYDAARAAAKGMRP
jgi:hypothetical protein